MTDNVALQALAEGEAFLLPAMQTLYAGARFEISISYNNNQYRTDVYVDEAFSALAQSNLSRQQIEHAVEKVKPYFQEDIDKLLKARDEKFKLDSLISDENMTETFGF